jgi:hypothetical protein
MIQLDLFQPVTISTLRALPSRHPLNDRVSGIVTGVTAAGHEIAVFYDFGERRWRYYGFPQMPPEIVAWRSH